MSFLREEINLRIERETRYVLELSKLLSPEEGIKLLKDKLEKNDEIINSLGKYIRGGGSDKSESTWETYYNDVKKEHETKKT